MAVPITNMKLSDITNELNLNISINKITDLFGLPIKTNGVYDSINPYGIDVNYCTGSTPQARYDNLTSIPFYIGKWRNYHHYTADYTNIKYGFLYNGYAAADPDIAPPGWHVPTNEDWIYIKNYLVENTTNMPFKSKRSIGYPYNSIFNTTTHPRWETPTNVSFYGANTLNFHAVPSGTRTHLTYPPPPINKGGLFTDLGYSAYFWTKTTTEFEEQTAGVGYKMYYNNSDIDIFALSRRVGASIRLVKDDSIWNDGDILWDIDNNAYGVTRIGNQLWTKQNLATTRYCSGTKIGQSINFIPFNVEQNDWYNVYNNIWHMFFPSLPDLFYQSMSDWTITTEPAFCTYGDDFNNAFRYNEDIFEFPSLWHEE